MRYQILQDYSNDSQRTLTNPKRMISILWSTQHKLQNIQFYLVQKLLEKVENYELFWANAERNCRLAKRPLPGEPDDGSFTGFESSLNCIKIIFYRGYPW